MVHGYSRMMAEDEVATIREVKQCRGIIDAHVREHHGRIVDSPGEIPAQSGRLATAK